MTRLFAAASATAAVILAWGSVTSAQTQPVPVDAEVTTTTTTRIVQGFDGTVETQERTTVTVASNEGGLASDTRIDTPEYARYFDDAGNPIYLPNVTFSLD